ncbi:hypothetical protein N7448_005256 [Penicillium atrosanguineum]|uniref:Uncharacterized protein n=1 Tax=Penicillium atrosanguineum TaxID=1132637 RepID=A0A9W9H334_9EURO|nr:hypothetical protein N7448_005256 [Penicillium atrosanguineum]KAJ5302931.1 hypothetical protein N7476_009730 [Penicillium atrosanguineum]
MLLHLPWNYRIVDRVNIKLQVAGDRVTRFCFDIRLKGAGGRLNGFGRYTQSAARLLSLHLEQTGLLWSHRSFSARHGSQAGSFSDLELRLELGVGILERIDVGVEM